MSDFLRSHGLQPTTLLHPWDSPGKSAGVGCHFLLQRIFLTQGLNPGLPHCRQTLYHLSHQGSQEKRPSSPTHPGFKLSQLFLGLPRWCCGQETARQCRRLKRHGFNPWVGKIPWRRAWQPTPVFLPGESHKHSDTTEATWHAHSISYLPPTQQHLKQCEAAHVCVATSEDRMRNRCEPGKRRAKRDELKRISQRQGQGMCI